MKSLLFPYILFCALFFACGAEDDNVRVGSPDPQYPAPQNPAPPNPSPAPGTTINYLALGDSYTIGQNVCESCRFPEQLKAALEYQLTGSTIHLSIIATTGWTTTNLISGIQANNPAGENDLVTLLIGVNNQYQHKPFSLYESEFPQLVETSIALAKGDKANLIVVSIPDYAYTPYGQASLDPQAISAELHQYNAFAQNYCAQNGIAFVNITDITQMGLQNPSLVASDGLHPSQSAYAQFVSRILPKALATLP